MERAHAVDATFGLTIGVFWATATVVMLSMSSLNQKKAMRALAVMRTWCRVEGLRDAARTSDHRTSVEVEYGTQVALLTGRDFLVDVPAFKEILDKLGLDAAFYHALGDRGKAETLGDKVIVARGACNTEINHLSCAFLKVDSQMR